ncbi:MAG TPA: hypothetical protein VGK67_05510 [Myxococcales bacterium]|jgi:hypothetical protein
MGGGGSYYDRDTKDGYDRGSSGTSTAADEKMGRRAADPGLLPKDRKIECQAKTPVVFAFDVTGSMGNLPKIIYDKMPLIAGQIMECGYLDDPQVSLAAVGDIVSDVGPIQIADFSAIRKLDDWLERIWLEGNGGGQAKESYEFTMYYYARCCDLGDPELPFFLITGDEGFRETLYKGDLERHFGGKHETIEAEQVVAELKKKFKDNVFIIRRQYSGSENEKIQVQWEKLLGKDFVIPLLSDQAIADVTLGVFAIAGGTRTLDEYLGDLKTKRAVPQTDERCAEVRKSLERYAALRASMAPARPKAAAAAAAAANPAAAGSASSADPKPPKADTGKAKGKGKKKGRVF